MNGPLNAEWQQLAAAEGGDGTPETDACADWDARCERIGDNEIVTHELMLALAHDEGDELRLLARRLERERNALAARVRELEADAERLDWAERQWADGIHIEKCAIGKCSGDRLEPYAAVYVGDEFQADTIRAAIDAARSK